MYLLKDMLKSIIIQHLNLYLKLSIYLNPTLIGFKHIVKWLTEQGWLAELEPLNTSYPTELGGITQVSS